LILFFRTEKTDQNIQQLVNKVSTFMLYYLITNIMKKIIILLVLLSGHFAFGQDYLIQEYTTGGSDAIYGKRNMAVANNGNIYATGLYNGTFKIQDSVVTGGGIYLAKFTNDLSLIWLKKVAEIMGSDAGGSLAAPNLMIALDDIDNVVIGYSAWGGSYLSYDDSIVIQTSNVELIKLDSSGVRLWRKPVTGSLKLGEKGVAVDGENKILITGKNSSNDVFIAKYDEQGNEIWYNSAGASGSTNVGTVVATDHQNNVYTSGVFYPTVTADTAYFGSHQIVFPIPCYQITYLAKYASDGTFQWVRYLYSSEHTEYTAYGSNTITSIECFENGNIALVGYFTNQLLKFSDGFSPLEKNGGTVGFRASFLASFNPNGDRLWAKTLHNTTSGGSHGVDLSIDSESSIYLLNEYWGTLVNDKGDSCQVNGGTSNDILLERYDEDGVLISSLSMGGSTNDIPYDLVTSGNSVYTYSANARDFPIGSDSILLAHTGINMVILKLTENPTLGIHVMSEEHGIELFPNPTAGNFSVRTPSVSGEISIYNISGKLVYKTKVQNTNQINVDLENVPNGIYFLNFKSDKFNITKKVVKN
jgi:hypothetical protein